MAHFEAILRRRSSPRRFFEVGLKQVLSDRDARIEACRARPIVPSEHDFAPKGVPAHREAGGSLRDAAWPACSVAGTTNRSMLEIVEKRHNHEMVGLIPS